MTVAKSIGPYALHGWIIVDSFITYVGVQVGISTGGVALGAAHGAGTAASAESVLSSSDLMPITKGGVGSWPFSPRNDSALYTVGVGQSANRYRSVFPAAASAKRGGLRIVSDFLSAPILSVATSTQSNPSAAVPTSKPLAQPHWLAGTVALVGLPESCFSPSGQTCRTAPLVRSSKPDAPTVLGSKVSVSLPGLVASALSGSGPLETTSVSPYACSRALSMRRFPTGVLSIGWIDP